MPPTVIGVAGSSARFNGWLDRLGLPVIIVTTLLFATPFLPRYGSLTTNVIMYGLIFSIAVVVTWKPLSETYREYRDSKRWFQGAAGETLASTELGKLPADYVVFHDFNPMNNDGKLAEWNIDHIVIGPTGVFIIETKNYSQARVQPAAHSSFTRKNVKQVQRTAAEFKKALIAWSGGQLADQFVVPVLVYVQPDAYVAKPQEGPVKVIPLKWLVGDITGWKGHLLDLDQTYRIARVLFAQLRPDLKNNFISALNVFGELSKRFKLDRAEARVQQQRAPGPPEAEVPTPRICPRCGGVLVRRSAKNGSRAGTVFLGCENFVRRNCRFTFNLQA